MKLYIDNHIFQLQKIGGISRYFSTFLQKKSKEYLIRSNIECYLHSIFHSNKYIQDLSLGYKLPIGKIIRILSSITFHISNLMIKKNSILHLSYYGRNLERVKAKGIRIISTLHDMIPEELNNMSEYEIKEKKYTFSSSNIILSVSETSAKKLISYYPDLKNRIHILKNVSPLPYLNNYSPLPKQLKENSYLLAFSGKAKYKNLNLLIKSYTYSSLAKSNIRLAIIGCGEKLDLNNLESFKDNIINNTIDFFSPTDAQLISLYKNSLAVCVLSSHEGFSIPLIEALHFDKKLIISNIDVHQEIGSSFANFVNPNSIESVIRSFESINKLKSPSDLLGEYKYREELKYYSPKRFLTEYIQILNTL